jgi:hypothetical protein
MMLISKLINKLSRHFYTLSFTYTLKYDNDLVYFAHSYPYDYHNDLIPFINDLAHNSTYNKFLRIGTLWHSFARNQWKMLTITENVKHYRDWNDELSWMNKSKAARRLIRLKTVQRKSIFNQVRRKTKQQVEYEKHLRRMHKFHNHK